MEDGSLMRGMKDDVLLSREFAKKADRNVASISIPTSKFLRQVSTCRVPPTPIRLIVHEKSVVSVLDSTKLNKLINKFCK